MHLFRNYEMPQPADRAMPQSRPKVPGRGLARLAISAALLLACFWLVDLGQLWSTLRGLNPAAFVIAALLYLASQVAVAARFQVALAALRRPVSLAEALRYHLVSQWFNQLLPTNFGGEVVKILMLRQRVGMRRAVRAVVLNRVLGLAALLAAAMLATLLAWGAGVLSGTAAAATLLVTGGASAAFAPVIMPRLTRRLARPLLAIPLVDRLVRLGLVFAADLRRMMAPQRAGPVLGYSAAVLVLTFATIVVLAAASGLGDSLGAVLWAAPLMILAMHLPISFGGWGTREVGAVAAFEVLGLPAEAGLAVSIAYGAANLVGSAAGAALILLGQRALRATGAASRA
jgi:glycosyltransferase 2 family protein